MDRQRPIASDTRAQRDHNPQGTNADGPCETSSREEAATSLSSPAGVPPKVSSTGTRQTFTSALLLCREIEVDLPGFPPQDGSIDCAMCIEREGTVWDSEGRLICEICDGDRARGLVA